MIFSQKKIRKNKFVRRFSNGVNEAELKWHRDQRDRVINVLEGDGWLFQRENSLPYEMVPGDKIFVKALEWHRIGKGVGDLVIEITESGSPHPSNYDAPEGSKRDKTLDQTKEDLEKAKELRKAGKTKQAKELEQRAYRRRDRMEKKERNKRGWKNKPRKDTKKESVDNRASLEAFVYEILMSEKCDLSKSTKKKLKKKAEEKGYTAGSVEKEYCAGLGAYNTSGSRKGMTQHQWAMARVNSATPSKDWAVVKKTKAKKKK
jgi:hypothetical protein